MPIRLNLLAEQLAEEELRRRDPVKRAGWACALLAVAVLAWSGYLQLKVMNAEAVLNGYKDAWNDKAKEYKQVTENLKKTAEYKQKLELLTALATNRFLVGPLLNALQFAGVDDIQLRLVQTESVFREEPAVKGKTNGAKITPPKPATSTETMTLTIEGRDYGSPPGDQSFRFRQKITTLPYFKTNIPNESSIALRGGLSAVQSDAVDASRSFVTFKLVCDFPPKIR
ncbi:MAG: hypothetical protein KGS61_14060 [Verrucomicrobia bacterium]|nr:hypothetical protein [Verrucomicrobiota bacterium]